MADRRVRTPLAAGILAVGFALSSAALLAKHHPPPTRTIEGTIFDVSSEPVDGAEVDLTDLTTGKTVSIYSMNKGQYSFAGLDMNHSFRVYAKFNGVASETRKVSFLEPRTDVVINLYLSAAKK